MEQQSEASKINSCEETYNLISTKLDGEYRGENSNKKHSKFKNVLCQK